MSDALKKQVIRKQEIISEIKEKIGKAASCVLVDGIGLSVEQDTGLRKNLREAGIDYKVYKNTMLELAFKDTPYASLDPFLVGPTAVVISYDDATAAARAVNKEIKGLPNLKFKAGMVEDTLYDAAGIRAVADIPSRNELLARLLGSFKSPMSSFARVVNEVAKAREGGAAPAAADAQVESPVTAEPAELAETKATE